MKHEIRMLAIRLNRRISKGNKQKELKLITKIIPLSEKTEPTSAEVKDLAHLQTELDRIYEEKATGAFIPSRRKWLEISSLSKLKINDTVKLISQYVVKL